MKSVDWNRQTGLDGLTFGDRLDELIKETGKQANQISKETGITEGSLSAYRNNNACPRADVVIKLANCFNVSTDYLLGLTTAKTTNQTLRKMSEYTHLSDASLKVLHEYPINSIQSSFLRRFFDDLLVDRKMADSVTESLKTYVEAMCYADLFNDIPNEYERPKPLPNGQFSISALNASEWYIMEAASTAEGEIRGVVEDMAEQLLREKRFNDSVNIENYKWPVYSDEE